MGGGPFNPQIIIPGWIAGRVRALWVSKDPPWRSHILGYIYRYMVGYLQIQGRGYLQIQGRGYLLIHDRGYLQKGDINRNMIKNI